jgi:hypothetical protein
MESILGKDADTSKMEWVRNSKGSIPEFYGNYIHATWTLYDARILLGQLKPELGNSPKFSVEEQASFVLAWAQTKNLAQILAGMVEAYESVNGEITVPKLAPRYEDMEKSEG